ncbi:hypothetical protein CEXT_445981 [Caerostris extrusa]|uniref:Transmembrane protein n=1 Tax=Caerostris extrusa TaxID=172846 RepID=A0AAV4UT06_CAEEX|nr:hypothetical protein CEXT_445981 [Caerostris extrusa]
MEVGLFHKRRNSGKRAVEDKKKNQNLLFFECPEISVSRRRGGASGSPLLYSCTRQRYAKQNVQPIPLFCIVGAFTVVHFLRRRRTYFSCANLLSILFTRLFSHQDCTDHRSTAKYS